MSNSNKPVRVLLGSPTGGSEYAAHKQSVFRLIGACNPELIWVTPRDCEGSNIAENQNELAFQALDEGYDYLLLAETDVAFPNHALAQMLSHGKDIIGCSTPWKERDLLAARLNGEERVMRYMGHELNETEITMASLLEGEPIRRVRFVPMGLTLISTRAIAAISAHRIAAGLPGDVADQAGGKRCSVFTHFECFPVEKTRSVTSTTDAGFCQNARDAGFDVWLEARLSLWVEHVGTCNFVAPEWMRQRAMAEAMKERAA